MENVNEIILDLACRVSSLETKVNLILGIVSVVGVLILKDSTAKIIRVISNGKKKNGGDK